MAKSKRIINSRKKNNNIYDIDGNYDPLAPKFKYVRDVMSNTRKTSRIKRDQQLDRGMPAPVDYKKNDTFGKYPWTKPLEGFKRVFIGYGKTVRKGRIKKGSAHKQFKIKTIKPPKKKFIKYSTTYGVNYKK